MKITQITVRYAETCSLPEYSNIRPEIGYTIDLDPSDDPTLVQIDALDEARSLVRQQIDDALESHGKKTKYYRGSRYQLLQSPGHPYGDILIMPDSTNDWPRGWTHLMILHDSRGLRPDYARREAQRIATQRGGRVIDCMDGNVSRVPPPPPAPIEDDEGEEETT